MNRSKNEKADKAPVRLIDMLGISSPKRIVVFLVCFLSSVVVFKLLPPEETGLTPAGHKGLFILIFAASLWVTDAIPAFSVGILIIGLQILLLGKPGAEL